MKKFLSVLLLTVSIMLINCQSNPQVDEIIEFPESLLIKGNDFKNFLVDYSNFLNNLTSDKFLVLSDYVNLRESHRTGSSSGRSKDEPNCNCVPGTNHCSASGLFNSCCICCGQKAAACGITVGVASCRCGDDEELDTRISGTYNDVTFYPNEFNEFLVFAEKSGIEVKAIRRSLITLVNSVK